MENLFSQLRISREQRKYDSFQKLNLQLARLNETSANDVSEVGGFNYQPSSGSPLRRVALENVSTSGSSSDRVLMPPPPPRPRNLFKRISVRDSLCAMIAYAEHKFDTERADKFPPMITDYLAPTYYRKLVPSGMILLDKTEAMLHRMIPKMYIFQKKLADEAFRVSLRQLLDDQFENLWEAVCKKRMWESAPRNLFAVASRRSGKTCLLAAFCAAMLVCVYRMTIIVYSVALRSAQEFVRLVQRYIQMVPEGRAMLTGPGGAERLALHGLAPEDERWIRSFPSGGNSQNVSLFIFPFSCRLAGRPSLCSSFH
jgi:hypothetical protein